MNKETKETYNDIVKYLRLFNPLPLSSIIEKIKMCKANVGMFEYTDFILLRPFRKYRKAKLYVYKKGQKYFTILLESNDRGQTWSVVSEPIDDEIENNA